MLRLGSPLIEKSHSGNLQREKPKKLDFQIFPG